MSRLIVVSNRVNPPERRPGSKGAEPSAGGLAGLLGWRVWQARPTGGVRVAADRRAG